MIWRWRQRWDQYVYNLKNTKNCLQSLEVRWEWQEKVSKLPEDPNLAHTLLRGYISVVKTFIVICYNSPRKSLSVHFSSVAQSCWTLCDAMNQHARPPCSSPSPGIHSNSRPSSRWYHPAISSSVIPFSSCPQSLPASESFPMSQLFAWGGQSTGISALASALPKNTQDQSPLEWTGWISLQSKGLSRVFSNTTVRKHQFLGTQLSLQSNSHIHTWPLEKP